ncbi:FAD:protein FMN transferase [Cloacibacterium rupense]|uniref:FAD:protein FMN transferase n=1 Tax=Cloacibacterium rupense TaxID=517423 RepID=A0ABQ2NEX5_9FLAO|nr:FAD:protein FMN transferase [Cloacibacterium rupense]GGP01644.1 FAD:protein FMN transferase [Cloacibacterium rupense]
MLKKRIDKLMGNRFEITVEANSNQEADYFLNLAVKEIKRIEEKLSTYKEHSETNLVNNNAGIKPVTVSEETFRLIQRSIKISEITQGAFDITYGSIDKRFWNFDTQMKTLPDRETAKELVKLINYKNIVLDENKFTVFLKEKGMRIGFGGIGKGYAAECAKKILISNGVKAGIVNASGDLTAFGKPKEVEKWTIGIANPDVAHQTFSTMEITDLAVATSGNYEKFVIIEGKKYSHTIDPKTGYPISGIKSVTIISPNAEISDAFATPVTIMGIRAGLAMINQIKGIECIIIDDDNNVYTSNQINLH